MKYNVVPATEIIEKTASAVRERGMQVFIVEDCARALSKIKEMIPKGASINNGSSTTLEEIGYIQYLKENTHGWNNLHAAVLAEKDPVVQAKLRMESVFSDYYLGSVHSIAETGEIIIASASGSQLPAVTFTASNIIFVVGAQKIVPTYERGMKRLREYVVSLEDKRMKNAGMDGTTLSKILTIEREPEFMGRKVTVILVKEKLGF